MRPYQLQQSYLLIDARQMTKENADSLAKIVLASCEAEPSDIPALFDKAMRLIVSAKYREMICRIFVDWFNILIKNTGLNSFDNQLEFEEANKMLEERIREWEQKMYNNGVHDCETKMSGAMSDAMHQLGISQELINQTIQITLANYKNQPGSVQNV